MTGMDDLAMTEVGLTIKSLFETIWNCRVLI